MTHPPKEDHSVFLYKQIAAGAMTGLLECSVLYPIDLIKTRMQSINTKPYAGYSSVFRVFLKIAKQEGTRRLFRGMTMPIILELPAHALYCVSYEKSRMFFSGKKDVRYELFSQALSGSIAKLGYHIIKNPGEVVKHRMQMYRSPYKSNLKCIKTIAKAEGIKAFYRSFPTQAAIAIPYGALSFVVYEECQNCVNINRELDPKSQIPCGALAGALAAMLTTPLDVCRTLLNTQEASALAVIEQTRIKGLRHAISIIYRIHGWKGFLQGMEARVAHQTICSAICWVTYEHLKYAMVRD